MQASSCRIAFVNIAIGFLLATGTVALPHIISHANRLSLHLNIYLAYIALQIFIFSLVLGYLGYTFTSQGPYAMFKMGAVTAIFLYNITGICTVLAFYLLKQETVLSAATMIRIFALETLFFMALAAFLYRHDFFLHLGRGETINIDRLKLCCEKIEKHISSLHFACANWEEVIKAIDNAAGKIEHDQQFASAVLARFDELRQNLAMLADIASSHKTTQLDDMKPSMHAVDLALKEIASILQS
jgi:hypothetical protein